MDIRPARGRPRTSTLTRAEQLRAAKRAQRQRERAAGFASVEMRLPAEQAARLKVALASPRFAPALDRALDELVVDLQRWPVLRDLAWNRTDRWIPADEALGLYERNWRFVELRRLDEEEAALVERLKALHGGGLLNA